MRDQSRLLCLHSTGTMVPRSVFDYNAGVRRREVLEDGPASVRRPLHPEVQGACKAVCVMDIRHGTGTRSHGTYTTMHGTGACSNGPYPYPTMSYARQHGCLAPQQS